MRIKFPPSIICLIIFFTCTGFSSVRFLKKKLSSAPQATEIDMSEVKNVREKKVKFFDFMRPIVRKQNNKILELREKLLTLKKKDPTNALIEKTAKKYSVEWNNDHASWKVLLRRVDAVPLELVLAQSANESNWGQSRFAQDGNNMFGEWCFTKGCGIVPRRRGKGETHEVQFFTSVTESVVSYLMNINSSRAYKGLRLIREKLRNDGQGVTGILLAEGLSKYSERGQEYVKEVQSMIRVNKKLMLNPS